MSGIKAETMGDAVRFFIPINKLETAFCLYPYHAFQVGLIAGHLYYTIQDAWPREMTHPTGKPIIAAPRWL